MGRVLLAVGISMIGAGLLLTVTPLSVAGSGWTLFVLAAVAVVALGAGVLTGLERSVTSTASGRLPTPDGRPGVRTPGDGFDHQLANLSAGDGADRDALHARLEAVALGVLVERRDWSRDTARARLKEGEWTDDPQATAFFRRDPASLRDRVRTVLTGEPTAARRARRVVDELAVIREDESG
ncbi:hypothetical protein ACFR9U_03880 [Halorientalis brevis]|uniref:Uncharacterized protein n=1 Tax=Halorientalis brevis TaxID=1126241 RepID=A0ABD6C8I1_9EURY|nr:hypothetical protein [Halorientalis brevis]